MADKTKMLIDKFHGDNYSSWARYMRGVFLTKSVWNVVNMTETPTFSDPRIKDEYIRTNNIWHGTCLTCFAELEIANLTAVKNGTLVHRAKTENLGLRAFRDHNFTVVALRQIGKHRAVIADMVRSTTAIAHFPTMEVSGAKLASIDTANAMTSSSS